MNETCEQIKQHIFKQNKQLSEKDALIASLQAQLAEKNAHKS